MNVQTPPALPLSAPALPSTGVALRRVQLGEISVFYREAGEPERPTVLLLHGFPTSSHMFRNLIPLIADRYHVVAPDLPGFGFTEAPGREAFSYSFDNLAAVMRKFVDAIGLDHFAIYVFDYGAPVGFRLAMAEPERVIGIVSQNGNAYEEGLSDGWSPIRAYWADPSEANRAALKGFLTLETTRWQYEHGTGPRMVAPEAWTLDHALMQRPGNEAIQLDLFGDYGSNVALYPAFQSYLAMHRPPLLAVWGQNDPFFLPPGAEAFRRDVPEAEIHMLDTGHCALETHTAEIAALMREFLGRKIG